MLSQDGYLREQDWEQLRTEDVQDTGDVMALLFGRAERGERSKTGQGQGLLVDYPGTREMLRARLSQVSPGDKIFKISQRTYRQLWHAASTSLAPPVDGNAVARDDIVTRDELLELAEGIGPDNPVSSGDQIAVAVPPRDVGAYDANNFHRVLQPDRN